MTAYSSNVLMVARELSADLREVREVKYCSRESTVSIAAQAIRFGLAKSV